MKNAEYIKSKKRPIRVGTRSISPSTTWLMSYLYYTVEKVKIKEEFYKIVRRIIRIFYGKKKKRVRRI